MALTLGGVIPAVLTPVDADLMPDYGRHLEHCLKLIEQGATGLSPLGTSGEAASFSAAERMRILERLIEGGVPPDRLLPGTGAAALTDTIELTRHALSVGVTSVLMVPPFYYKGVSDEGLFRGYARVVETVADDGLRVVLYHIPPVTAVALSLDLVGRLREEFPATFAGVKDSSGDFTNLVGLVDRFPGLAVFTGTEPLLAPLMRIGGVGTISGLANVATPELRRIVDGAKDSSRIPEIEDMQMRVSRLRAAAVRSTSIVALKAMVAEERSAPSWRLVRPPLTPATAEAGAKLATTMRQLLGRE
jgi:4-hydroxy-tetrahydrodipicolinate synthase